MLRSFAVTQKRDDDDQNETHEIEYTGSREESSLEPLDPTPAPPPQNVAQAVALSILCGGRGSMKSQSHFVQRMRQRNFDVFDVSYAIRNGKCIKSEYCPDYKNHKFTFRGLIDGVWFDATFALSARHDFVKTPLMWLISGCWKTEDGTRFVRY
jgi:hypothetical protein